MTDDSRAPRAVRRGPLAAARMAIFLSVAAGAVGCAGKEFRAFDGPADPARDVRLTFHGDRVRIVSADGVAVPRSFGEANGDRTLWVRGDASGNVRLTLGIAPHFETLRSDWHQQPIAPVVPVSGGMGFGYSHAAGSSSTLRYPGSSRNQIVAFPARAASRYEVALDGKLGPDRKPVWGFVIMDEAAKAPVTAQRTEGWEPNATGGVDATPWNLWELPDDAIDIRSEQSN